MKSDYVCGIDVLCLLVLVIALFAGSPAIAAQEQGGRQGHPPPPPEAFEACQGKSVGAAVTFQSPRGGTTEATCQEVRSRMVAVPKNPPQRGRGQRPGGQRE